MVGNLWVSKTKDEADVTFVCFTAVGYDSTVPAYSHQRTGESFKQSGTTSQDPINQLAHGDTVFLQPLHGDRFTVLVCDIKLDSSIDPGLAVGSGGRCVSEQADTNRQRPAVVGTGDFLGEHEQFGHEFLLS